MFRILNLTQPDSTSTGWGVKVVPSVDNSKSFYACLGDDELGVLLKINSDDYLELTHPGVLNTTAYAKLKVQKDNDNSYRYVAISAGKEDDSLIFLLKYELPIGEVLCGMDIKNLDILDLYTVDTVNGLVYLSILATDQDPYKESYISLHSGYLGGRTVNAQGVKIPPSRMLESFNDNIIQINPTTGLPILSKNIQTSMDLFNDTYRVDSVTALTEMPSPMDITVMQERFDAKEPEAQ